MVCVFILYLFVVKSPLPGEVRALGRAELWVPLGGIGGNGF
jgi:hypothetical protein